MKNAPLTCLDFWCKAGSSYEQAGEEGLAHFLEHMVFKGSKCNRAGEFDRKIEELGGSSNAATGFDDVHFHILIPPKEIPPALELLLDLVLQPSLLEKDYSLEREVVLEEIAQHEDQPEEQVIQKLLSVCWENHSYGRPILGYKESLRSSNPERMRDFHKRLYTSQNCCLSIAGQIPNGTHELLENSLLKDIPEAPLKNASLMNTPNPEFSPKRLELQISRLESARLVMAWPIEPAKEQLSIMGADIATSLFAEGRRSRLVERLREELQIVESIDMDVTVLEQSSLILLEACCKEEQLTRVEKEINKVLRESLTELPSEQELIRASHLIGNGLCFNLEASGQVAAIAGYQSLWNRPQPLMEPLSLLSYWTGERLRDLIFSRLQPEMSCTLIATPSKKD